MADDADTHAWDTDTEMESESELESALDTLDKADYQDVQHRPNNLCIGLSPIHRQFDQQ